MRANRTLRVVACAGALIVAGCSASNNASRPSSESSVALTPDGTAETTNTATNPSPTSTGAARPGRASAEQAVTALLEAEQALDHDESFLLLSSRGLAAYPSASLWARRRSEVARITGFSRQIVRGTDVTMLVRHAASIDPFVGLQFAEERQTWHTRKESDGWLVDPEPDVEPIIPSEAGIKTDASRWVTARQSCDDTAAGGLQAIPALLHVSAGAASLCGASEVAKPSEPSVVDPGPQTADLVAQYGAGILRYVRTVRFSGLPNTLQVFLVPIDKSWRVVSTGD